MNRYMILSQLGDGTYGTVVLGQRKDNNEKVAIKRMKRKYYSWEEAMALREVKVSKKNTALNILEHNCIHTSKPFEHFHNSYRFLCIIK